MTATERGAGMLQGRARVRRETREAGNVRTPAQPAPAAQITHPAMGTIMAHRAYGARAAASLAAVRREIAQIEGRLSRFLPDSEISRINAAAGAHSAPISAATYEVLEAALAFSRRCPDCFAVTIAPLVGLWQAARAARTPPEAARIRQRLPLVNDRDLRLDPQAMTAELRQVGQALDLGGIGKGYAGDRILEIFRRFGITSAYSNLGGNVVTLGAKPDGSPWQIGIQHPRAAGRLIGAVAVAGETVVTSGDYQRTFTDRRGRQHHHILDPTTGYPAAAGLVSVTIVTATSLVADPLATMVFVAGMEKGRACLAAFPQTDAVLVDTELNVYVTPGLRDRFQAAAGINMTVLD